MMPAVARSLCQLFALAAVALGDDATSIPSDILTNVDEAMDSLVAMPPEAEEMGQTDADDMALSEAGKPQRHNRHRRTSRDREFLAGVREARRIFDAELRGVNAAGFKDDGAPAPDKTEEGKRDDPNEQRELAAQVRLLRARLEAEEKDDAKLQAAAEKARAGEAAARKELRGARDAVVKRDADEKQRRGEAERSRKSVEEGRRRKLDDEQALRKELKKAKAQAKSAAREAKALETAKAETAKALEQLRRESKAQSARAAAAVEAAEAAEAAAKKADKQAVRRAEAAAEVAEKKVTGEVKKLEAAVRASHAARQKSASEAAKAEKEADAAEKALKASQQELAAARETARSSGGDRQRQIAKLGDELVAARKEARAANESGAKLASKSERLEAKLKSVETTAKDAEKQADAERKQLVGEVAKQVERAKRAASEAGKASKTVAQLDKLVDTVAAKVFEDSKGRVERLQKADVVAATKDLTRALLESLSKHVKAEGALEAQAARLGEQLAACEGALKKGRSHSRSEVAGVGKALAAARSALEGLLPALAKATGAKRQKLPSPPSEKGQVSRHVEKLLSAVVKQLTAAVQSQAVRNKADSKAGLRLLKASGAVEPNNLSDLNAIVDAAVDGFKAQTEAATKAAVELATERAAKLAKLESAVAEATKAAGIDHVSGASAQAAALGSAVSSLRERSSAVDRSAKEVSAEIAALKRKLVLDREDHRLQRAVLSGELRDCRSSLKDETARANKAEASLAALKGKYEAQRKKFDLSGLFVNAVPAVPESVSGRSFFGSPEDAANVSVVPSGYTKKAIVWDNLRGMFSAA